MPLQHVVVMCKFIAAWFIPNSPMRVKNKRLQDKLKRLKEELRLVYTQPKLVFSDYRTNSRLKEELRLVHTQPRLVFSNYRTYSRDFKRKVTTYSAQVSILRLQDIFKRPK